MAGRRPGARVVDVTSLGMPRLASGTFPVLLDHATLLRLRAGMARAGASSPVCGVPEPPSGFTLEDAEFTVFLSADGLDRELTIKNIAQFSSCLHAIRRALY